jgi:hypothetical protein
VKNTHSVQGILIGSALQKQTHTFRVTVFSGQKKRSFSVMLFVDIRGYKHTIHENNEQGKVHFQGSLIDRK